MRHEAARFVLLPVFAVLVTLDTAALAGVVGGRVTGPDGGSVAGAEVLAASSSPEPGAFVVGQSDENGRFALEVPGEPPYTVRAAAPGLAASERRGVTRGEEIHLALGAGHWITGHVMERDTGRPLAGADVMAEPPEPGPFARAGALDHLRVRATTGEHGAFFVGPVSAGAWLVRAGAPGYAWRELRDTRLGPQAAPLAILLYPAAALAGTPRPAGRSSAPAAPSCCSTFRSARAGCSSRRRRGLWGGRRDRCPRAREGMG
jgi:hypothetical protein